MIVCDQCLFTIVTPGFIEWLDTMLASAGTRGRLNNATLVVFAFGSSQRCEEVFKKYNAQVIRCGGRPSHYGLYKTASLAIAQVANAKKYLYMDADVVALDRITGIFDVLEGISEGQIMIARDAQSFRGETLGDHIACGFTGYYGDSTDLDLLRMSRNDRDYDLIVNAGVYAGDRKAMLSLESAFDDTMPHGAIWDKKKIDHKITWREQGLVNLCMARLGTAVEMSGMYNAQMHNDALGVTIEYQKDANLREPRRA